MCQAGSLTERLPHGSAWEKNIIHMYTQLRRYTLAMIRNAILQFQVVADIHVLCMSNTHTYGQMCVGRVLAGPEQNNRGSNEVNYDALSRPVTPSVRPGARDPKRKASNVNFF